METIKQKPRLQANNIDLNEIFSSINNLPPAGTEDVSEEITALTEAVNTHYAMVQRKVAENNGEGEYVWKKYGDYIAPITFSFTQTQTYPMIVTVSSNDIDLTEVDGTFFAGVKMSSSGTSTTLEFLDNMKVLYITNVTTEMDYTYTASTCQIEINQNPGKTYTWNDYTTEESKTFLDYVVSSDETAYPDGGLQDGYWYERVEGYSADEVLLLEMFGCTKMAVDTFTYSARSAISDTTFSHSLGEAPKIAFLISATTATTVSDVDYAVQMNIAQTEDSAVLYANLIHFKSSTYYSYNSGNGYCSSDNNIQFQGHSYYYLTAGVKYTLITMA